MSVFDDNDIQAKSAETIVMDWLKENVKFTENFQLKCVDYIQCKYEVITTGDVKIINKDIKDFCGGMIRFEAVGNFSCNNCKYLENINGISLISHYVTLTGCESITELPDFIKGAVIICDDCFKLRINGQKAAEKNWTIVGSGFHIAMPFKNTFGQAYYNPTKSSKLMNSINSILSENYIDLLQYQDSSKYTFLDDLLPSNFL